MPTIKDKLKFNFNGVWSDTFGLVNISLDNGMYEESLVGTREMIETKPKGSKKTFLHSIEDTPLEFEMNIAFENGYTDSDIDTVIQWLFVNQFKPLYFEGKENKIYMCIPTGDSKIVHNGLNQGYFTITMRCDSSNVYSPLFSSSLVSVTTESTITLDSDSHFDVLPEISIYKKGIGTIIIESLDDDNNIFEVRDLTDLEDIYINCEKEIIETDAIGFYRYDNIVGDFPRIKNGANRFKITGSCDIQFRYKKTYRF